MGIDTGELTRRAKNAVFKSQNIISILFIVLLQISFYVVLYDYKNFPIAIEAFVSFYRIQLGLTVSKPQIQTRRVQDSEGNVREQKIVQSEFTRISIPQSMHNFVYLFVHNLIICSIMVSIQTAINYILKQLLNIYLLRLETLSDSFYAKILQANTEGWFDINTISLQIAHSFTKQQLVQFYYCWIGIFVISSMNFGFYYFMNLYKIALCAELQRLQQENNNDIGNGKIFLTTLKQFFRLYLNWQTIKAQIRLNLRLWWVHITFYFLSPYLDICEVFLYRLIYLEMKQKDQKKREREQRKMKYLNEFHMSQIRLNLNAQANEQRKQNNNEEDKQQEVLKNENKDREEIMIQKQAKNNNQQIIENKQITLNQNTQNVPKSQIEKMTLSEVLGKQMYNQLFQKVKQKHQTKSKQKRNQNKIYKLIYYPYTNDVSWVKTYKKRQ